MRQLPALGEGARERLRPVDPAAPGACRARRNGDQTVDLGRDAALLDHARRDVGKVEPAVLPAADEHGAGAAMGDRRPGRRERRDERMALATGGDLPARRGAAAGAARRAHRLELGHAGRAPERPGRSHRPRTTAAGSARAARRASEDDHRGQRVGAGREVTRVCTSVRRAWRCRRRSRRARSRPAPRSSAAARRRRAGRPPRRCVAPAPIATGPVMRTSGPTLAPGPIATEPSIWALGSIEADGAMPAPSASPSAPDTQSRFARSRSATVPMSLQ